MCFRYGQAVVIHILTDADWPFASRHPVRQVERRPLLDPPGASEVHEHASPGDMKLAALFLEFGATAARQPIATPGRLRIVPQDRARKRQVPAETPDWPRRIAPQWCDPGGLTYLSESGDQVSGILCVVIRRYGRRVGASQGPDPRSLR